MPMLNLPKFFTQCSLAGVGLLANLGCSQIAADASDRTQRPLDGETWGTAEENSTKDSVESTREAPPAPTVTPTPTTTPGVPQSEETSATADVPTAAPQPCEPPDPRPRLPPIYYPDESGATCGYLSPSNEFGLGIPCTAKAGGGHKTPACYNGLICTDELAPLGAQVDGVFHCTRPCIADNECGTGARCCAPKGLPGHPTAGPINFCFINECADDVCDE
jgi:hypothetical protein